MSEPTSTATPQPADLDEFDLDDFLDGITTPTKTVPICKDRVLAQQMLDVERRIGDLEQQDIARRAEGKPSSRRAASTESPDLEAARAELTTLEERARDAFFFVQVEPLTRMVRKQATKDAQDAGSVKDPDITVYNDSCLSQTARLFEVDPREDPDAPGRVLLPAQWARLADRIGQPQYDRIIEALTEVSVVTVSPDFSRPASPSASGQAPSSS